MLTVFWPIDVKRSGFCYGWNAPSVCIAGVLELSAEQEAKEALKKALHCSIQWRYITESCGSEPVILGKCVFGVESVRSKRPTPFLQLRNCGDYTLIYYCRHQSNTLRFHTLDIPKHNVPSRETVAGSAYLNSVLHDFTAPKRDQFVTSINDVVLNQFNSSKSLEQALSQPLKTEEPKLLKSFIPVGSLLLRIFARVSVALSTICNFSIVPPHLLLKDVSATIQQIDVRAEQMDFFAAEAGSLRRRTSTPIHVYSGRYTNFFNAVWLILNDIIMGVALGSFICENHVALARLLVETAEDFLVSWVQWTLQWLDSWPAGLKLNTELSHFYSHTFIGLVTVWGGFLQKGAPYLPTVIYVIGVLSSGGMTITISLLLDVLALLTAHICICYVLSRAVYQRMLKSAGSLWNLFRGKRYNVLRNRTDSWEYDIDQLLFGTIFFTLLAFLFPTVLVYYSLFALLRLCVLVIQASLETLLALMNHFPLFALMLRVKDPWRLPGGIHFVLEESPGSETPYIVIKNQPVPLSTIFFQYIELLSRLAKHYNPLRLLWCLLSGQHLAAIPPYSIRCNKIPEDSDS
ncbi:hypothetical protein H2248_001880 [Termitomyces sp. 'cryptogamus']|nr:hypothetical protein H2248_001880 [Termitomyces sp. 'cryptogamus']